MKLIAVLAVMARPARPSVIVDFGPGSSATGINSSGQIVGSNATGGFLYSSGAMTQINGSPKAINDFGQIVGTVKL